MCRTSLGRLRPTTDTLVVLDPKGTTHSSLSLFFSTVLLKVWNPKVFPHQELKTSMTYNPKITLRSCRSQRRTERKFQSLWNVLEKDHYFASKHFLFIVYRRRIVNDKTRDTGTYSGWRRDESPENLSLHPSSPTLTLCYSFIRLFICSFQIIHDTCVNLFLSNLCRFRPGPQWYVRPFRRDLWGRLWISLLSRSTSESPWRYVRFPRCFSFWWSSVICTVQAPSLLVRSLTTTHSFTTRDLIQPVR